MWESSISLNVRVIGFWKSVLDLYFTGSSFNSGCLCCLEFASGYVPGEVLVIKSVC